MKKITYISKNRILFKYILLVLTLLLIVMMFLLKFKKNKTSLVAKRDNYTIQIKEYRDKADNFYFESNYDSSFYYYKKGLSICNPEINCVDYVYFLSSVADLYTIYSNYIESEAILTQTLPYLHKIKEPIYARNVYTYIAFNYYNTYDYNNAIYYHRKALKLPGTPYKKAIILVNVAIVYVQQKRYQEAIDLLQPLAARKVVYKREPAESDKLYAQILDNLGFCYFNLNKPNALKYFRKSLGLNTKLKDEFPIIHNYKNLALYYEKYNHYLAINYAKKSYAQACKINSASNKANCLGLLIKLCEGKELKNYSQDYVKIIDSIIIGRKKSKNQFSTIKYFSKQDKNENLQLKAEKAENDLQIERQVNQNIILSIIIVLILGVIGFIYFYLTLKTKKEKKEVIYKKETELSGKLRDKLADDVYRIITFARNSNLESSENKTYLLNILDNIYSQTRNISKENSKIITNENYLNELKEMISGFKTQNLNLIINGLDTISWNKIDKNKKIILYRTVYELFQTMKKHHNATLIILSFKIINKNIEITYVDNGAGIHNNMIFLKNSLQNVENRIKTINGTLNFDLNIEKGYKLSFTFPV